MYYDRLHAWWSTQSLLTTLLISFIACRWVGPHPFDGSDLKTYLQMRGLGPDIMSLAEVFGQATRVLLLDFFCSGTYLVICTVEALSLFYLFFIF